MVRARSPERDKARQMWLESSGTMKLKDIAAALFVGENKVRKWKSIDHWEKELKGNVPPVSKGSVPIEMKGNAPHRGAPKGNKNAVGNCGGAPPGNKNAKGNSGGSGGPVGNKKAVTTGEHETIWMDTLTEIEQQLIDQVDTDPINQANESLYLLAIRERRMMHRIKSLMDGLSETERSVLYEMKAIKEVAEIHDEKTGITKKIPHSRNEMMESKIEEKGFRKLDDIVKLEEALTRIQDKKIRAIELKNRLTDDEKRIRIETMEYELQMLRGGGKEDFEDDGFMDALKGRAAEVWNYGEA
ncbi:phage terminase small subunit-related protein [Paenibacillus etheri]|uniref:Terminase n=1 Tax=Paenibacillus etheri TaxID=1306852 RepID=A0A0W1B3N2_9BACL|nr:phage terminase small subunit-related protein [Paenibacillus etheri]KTD88164.1 terminase [Paenibacillus etheri]